MIQVGHAAAIANGLCDVALITHGESGRSRVGQADEARHPQSPAQQYVRPFGLPSPYGAYVMACARHMHDYGTTRADLAEIAVATRK